MSVFYFLLMTKTEGFAHSQRGGVFRMTTGQHHIIHQIAGAIEEYGESAVFDVVARYGDYTEIIASFNIGTGVKLQRIARYHSHDGIKFTKRE